MKKTIITITNNNLVLEIVDSKSENHVLARDVSGWKKGGLKKVLRAALSSANDIDSIRILLTGDFYYLAGFEVEKKLANNRDKIRGLAEEVIPENLEKVRWDYGVIGEHKNLVSIQCFALTKDFDRELAESLEEISVKVEAIEPYSLAIMRSFKSNRPSFVLLHKDKIATVSLIVKDGLVLFSKYFDLEKFDESLQELAAFSEKFYKLKPKKLILSGVNKSLADKALESLSLTVTEVEIFANLNLLEKTSIKGKDSKILNIDEKSTAKVVDVDLAASEDEQIEEEQTEENSHFALILLGISIAGIVIGFFVTKFF